MPLLFNSSLGVKLDVSALVRELTDFIKIKPNNHYKIIIGTDSEQLADKNADFVTAVVVHRLGNGGRYFWRRIELGKFHTLRDRIIKEVLLSLDVAKEILTELKKSPELKNWDFEIHADIGENGETKTLIQEVVGIIRANNFAVRTKPESYAATKVADRHV
jgi:predicted RNase H-related nuclease YkuK (DUF458 family)